MNPDTFLMVAFGLLIGLFVIMMVVGIPRGRRMQDTNAKIEENQRKQMETGERQAKALERIADALEKRR